MLSFIIRQAQIHIELSMRIILFTLHESVHASIHSPTPVKRCSNYSSSHFGILWIVPEVVLMSLWLDTADVKRCHRTSPHVGFVVVDIFLAVCLPTSKEYRAKYAKFVKRKTIMPLWVAITAGLGVRAFLFFGKNPEHFSR